MGKPLTWSGKPVTISWSGIETFNDCRRKWAYGYIERKRYSKTATEIGSKVHDLAEAYLKGELTWDPASEDPPNEHLRYWRILEPGLLYAPTPEEVDKDGWGVETWLESIRCGPLDLVGKVDIHKKPVVTDWKTTSSKDFDWSKTPEQLAHHGQPLLYAYGLHHTDPPATLDFQHINMVTKGKPDAMEVWAYDVPWERCVEEFEKAKLIAVEMHAVADGYHDADKVPSNQAACSKFGGCPHAEYCSASPLNRDLVDITPNLQGITVQNTQTAKTKAAELREKFGIKSTTSPVTPKPRAERAEPTKEDKVAKVTALFEQMLDQQGFVPVPVAEILASSEGIYVSDVTIPLQLRNDDGKFVVKEDPPVTASFGIEVSPGTTVKELMAHLEELDWDDVPSLADTISSNELQISYGLLVPRGWSGTVTEAYITFRPDTVEASKAEVIEEVEAAAEPEAKPVPTEPAVTPAVPRVAAEEKDKPAPKPQPTVNGNTEDNVRAAGMLIQALESSGGSLSKPAAAGIVRSAIPGLQRIRTGRWDAVLAQSAGRVFMRGSKVLLVEANPSAPEVITSDHRGEPWPEPDDTMGDPEACAEPRVTPNMQAIKEAGDELANTPAIVQEVSVTFRGPELFVNCMPVNEEAVTFSHWVFGFERMVSKALDGAHPFTLPYNDGAKAVLALVVNALDQGPGALPPVMSMDTSHWLASHVLPLIERMGGSVRIVKAVR